jgi:hypothetical protein
VARLYYNQQAFNYGELGNLLWGRGALSLYSKAGQTCYNFRPTIQGPLIKRKGTKYVAEVKDSADTTRLVKFIFSETDSVVLEFGDLYIRFYSGTSQVMSGMSPYEIVSPYSSADLANLKFAQIGDIMYISHPSYKPRKLSRLAATSWTIAELDYQLGPCRDFNESTTTITLSGTLTKSGTSTWTASASTFVASDVGTVWAIAKSTDKTIVGYAKMAGYTSATVATFTNQVDLTPVTVTATVNWKKPSWSTTHGWPRAVAFHEQRLFWAGTSTEPLTVWGSIDNASYENYDIGTGASDDAVIFELSGVVNTIQWLKSNGNFLVAGTYGGLAFIGSGSGDVSLNPTNVRARVGSSFGASAIQGVQANDRVVYAHSNNKALYKAEYDDVTLQYRAFDFTDFNNDILSESITTDIDTIEQPDLTVVTIGTDGNLKLLSYDETQGSGNMPLFGWYEYDFDGDVQSVAVVPTTSDDRVWMIVQRTINGSTKKYVEYIDISDDDYYVDCGIVYNGTATRTFSGLSHLEGKVVSVWGDGSYVGTYTVSSGSITIPTSKTAIEEAYIGLGFNSDWVSMPIAIPLQETGNTTQTINTRINELQVVLYKTGAGLNVGTDLDNLITVPFRSTYDAMTEAVPLFGGTTPDIKQIAFGGTWTRQPYVALRHDLPLPCTVIGFTARMEANPN